MADRPPKRWLRPLSRLQGWLSPGLGIKRWLVLLLLGVIALGMGIAFALQEMFHGGWLPPFWQVMTLQFIPRPLRALLLVATGFTVLVLALRRLYQEMTAPVAPAGESMVDLMVARKRKAQGPRVVVIGGGTGQAMLLRGLKQRTSNITAVVTVADDGGSSGRLRRSLGILPPGDFRNCMVALADDEDLLAKLFQYRFSQDFELGGHSFGNLFITAMAAITGAFERGVGAAGQVLKITGQVLPSTLADVALVADIAHPSGGNLRRVAGESTIPHVEGQIHRVYLEPDAPPAYPPVVQAILAADLIVIGPGSLYTSILPNLLVPDIAAAIKTSRATRVYVCNVATQPGETDHFTVDDHVRAIEQHVGAVFGHVLANSNQAGHLPNTLAWVPPPAPMPNIILADVVDTARPWRHDSLKLANALLDWLAGQQRAA